MLRAGWLTPSAFEYQYVLGCGVRTVSTPRLDREVVDVLWVATKAMRLDPAEALAPPDRVRAAIVITLRNGVDHVALLPKRYPNVVSGVIRVELERVSPALIRQSPPSFAWSSGAYNRPLPNCGRQGIDCSTRDDELSLLWETLAFFAPVALPGGGRTAYPPSKAAVWRYGETLANELAGRIPVFFFSPGLVRTEMTEGMGLFSEDAPWTPPELVRKLATGRYDALAGRYLHAEHDDVGELLARGDEVRERDLNAIRLRW